MTEISISSAIHTSLTQMNSFATAQHHPINPRVFRGFIAFCLSILTFWAESIQAQRDPELAAFLKSTIVQASSFDDKYDAEVWLVDMSQRLSRYMDDPKERLTLLKQVHRLAKAHDIQPSLVLAVMEVESHFNRFAISRVGAQGVMQVMPFWKDEIGRPEDNLTDLETNITYGVTILKHYLDREKGRWPQALARYNGSYGSYRYSTKVMDAWQKRWK